MKLVLSFFLLLAACGLCLSIIVHGLAVAGTPIPGGKLVWALHGGVFVVWLPAVLVAMRAAPGVDRKDLWKLTLAGCPRWMQVALRVLFGYAVVNFVLFIAAAPRGVQRPGDDPPPAVVRGFSGHWMVFYGAAFAILYSRLRAPHLFREHRCPQGHVVPPLARFCPACGCAVSPEHADA